LIALAALAASNLHADMCLPPATGDTCVDYTLNFYEASGSHLPTGTFFQDLTNPFSDVISISWNGFSFTFDYPSSEDLFYNLQQYTMFDQNQASILAPCAGANYSEEEVMILEGCAGQGYLVDWRGLGYSNTALRRNVKE